MKMIRYILPLLLVLIALPCNAVLKEKSLGSTLSILRSELTDYHTELQKQSSRLLDQQEQVRTNLMNILNESNQNSLMLYSQRQGRVFDLTYACHEATEQYREFQKNIMPFRSFVEQTDGDIARYDSLITSLSKMTTFSLSQKALTDRSVCLALAVNIRRTLKENRDQFSDYIMYYKMTESNLKHLDDYANKRYREIQNDIFHNGDDSYFEILGHISHQLRETTQSMEDKYKPYRKVHSDWDSRIILGLLVIVIIGGFIAFILNEILIRFIFGWLIRTNRLKFVFDWFLKKKEERTPQVAFMTKRRYIIMTSTVVTFALMLFLLRIGNSQSFIIMACKLLIEFAWLMGVILISLLIRLDGNQIKGGFRIYLPLMVIGFIVISFRIILIPNMLVNFIFPPILLICMIWQWKMIAKYKREVPRRDSFYAYTSLIVFIFSVFCSWIGYTLLAVQMLIWWIMQLTCILTITCFSSMLKNYGKEDGHRYFSDDTPITHTWFFRFIYQVILPSMGALSVIIAIYWAADVFNLTDTTMHIFRMKLIDSENFTFSLIGLVQILVLYFLFKYINHTSISMLHYTLTQHEKQKAESEKRQVELQSIISRVSMSKNVIQVITWGIFTLICLSVFHINNTWFVVVSGGLSTGVGFALKDILENIYYGISLMAGRIKVGDYIECDGTRGTVKSISYTSTVLEALDGSMIAFQNSQLFNKNYKNLTKNHGNELGIIPIGVAYGSNTTEVKQILEDAVHSIERKNYIKFIKVVFTGFGENSIDFKLLTWVDSRKAIYAKSDIIETAYNTLNKHGIEIPFPQCDVHIIHDNDIKGEGTPSITEKEEQISKTINTNK